MNCSIDRIRGMIIVFTVKSVGGGTMGGVFSSEQWENDSDLMIADTASR